MKKIYGGLSIFDNSLLNNAKELRFGDADSSNYAAIKAPATIATNYTLTLPTDDGNSGQFLTTDGSGVLSWTSALSSALTDGGLFIGNSSNIATETDTDLVGDVRAYISSFTFVDGDVTPATDTINHTSHGLEQNQIIYLTSTGTLPAGLSANTPYYVLVTDADNFKLSTSADGSAVDITAAAGGGTHTVHAGGLQLKSGVVANANIAPSAAITLSKLAALTASRALQSDGSGVISVSAVTTTELGYLSGVTSAIQTQLNGKASTALGNLASVAINASLVASSDNAIDLGSSAITWRRAYLKTSLVLQQTGAGTNSASIQSPASLASSYTLTLPVDTGTSGQVLSTDGTGVTSWVSRDSGFATNWVTGDGTTKTVTHNLGSKDVLVALYDKTDDSTIEVDTEIRTDTNTVTLTSSQAPGAAGWRVLVVRAN